MSSTTPRATDRRPGRGFRISAPLAVAVLALAAAGCGGGDSSSTESGTTAPDSPVVASVEQALYNRGGTQTISCESLGAVAVAGVSREVTRCMFEEEKDASGEMRARGGCFVVEDGAAVDVTMKVPADVTCFTKP
jgi:hypothetical protein